MKIIQNDEIDNNIVSTEILVGELGNSELTSEQEENLLANYPKTIEFNKITFSANMKIENKVPIITTETADSSTIVEVSIKDIINKEYVIDKNLNIKFSIDSSKIPDSELNAVFDSKEMLAQAKVVLFADKIKKAITDKLTEIRDISNTFEGETSYTL